MTAKHFKASEKQITVSPSPSSHLLLPLLSCTRLLPSPLHCLHLPGLLWPCLNPRNSQSTAAYPLGNATDAGTWFMTKKREKKKKPMMGWRRQLWRIKLCQSPRTSLSLITKAEAHKHRRPRAQVNTARVSRSWRGAVTRQEDVGKARLSIKSSARAKGDWRQRQGAEASFPILHPENHTSRCVDTGNANVALRVEPQPVTGLLNTHLFHSIAPFFHNFCKSLFSHFCATTAFALIYFFYIFLKNASVTPEQWQVSPACLWASHNRGKSIFYFLCLPWFKFLKYEFVVQSLLKYTHLCGVRVKNTEYKFLRLQTSPVRQDESVSVLSQRCGRV